MEHQVKPWYIFKYFTYLMKQQYGLQNQAWYMHDIWVNDVQLNFYSLTLPSPHANWYSMCFFCMANDYSLRIDEAF